MSDITDRSRPEASQGVETVVPGWRPSSTLDALQELVDVAAQVPHEFARAAGLSTSELHSLRHLMDHPMGPVDCLGGDTPPIWAGATIAYSQGAALEVEITTMAARIAGP